MPRPIDTARTNLQQQVASGGINQAQANAELQRLRRLPKAQIMAGNQAAAQAPLAPPLPAPPMMPAKEPSSPITDWGALGAGSYPALAQALSQYRGAYEPGNVRILGGFGGGSSMGAVARPRPYGGGLQGFASPFPTQFPYLGNGNTELTWPSFISQGS